MGSSLLPANPHNYTKKKKERKKAIVTHSNNNSTENYTSITKASRLLVQIGIFIPHWNNTKSYLYLHRDFTSCKSHFPNHFCILQSSRDPNFGRREGVKFVTAQRQIFQDCKPLDKIRISDFFFLTKQTYGYIMNVLKYEQTAGNIYNNFIRTYSSISFL